MTGEEMEITTDFGHQGPGEDIDIDLDLTTEQPDGDVELGDFNPAQLLSDSRDELMAEGDDGTYGMIDADEIGYNNSAAAANDYDIDIGTIGDNLWQTSNVATSDGKAVPKEEANSTMVVASENFVVDQIIPDAETWLQEEQEQTADNNGAALQAAAEMEPLLHDIDSSDVLAGLPSTDYTVNEEGIQLYNPEGSLDAGLGDVDLAEIKVKTSLAAENDVGGLKDQPSDFPDSTPDAGANKAPGGETTKVEEISSLLEVQEEQGIQGNDEQKANSEIEFNQLYDDDQFGEEDDGSFDPENSQHSEKSAEQDSHHFQHDSTWTGGSVDMSAAGEGQQDNSYKDNIHDHDGLQAVIGQDDEHDSSITSGVENGQDDSNTHVIDDERDDNRDPGAQIPVGDHLLSVAMRHEILINYGETDYRLFAKSVDDDPEQYFLSEMSAVERPLSDLLSGIREVISNEVSPLDELVMYVDALGVEFGETTTTDFLEKFTFGDILVLYDTLVRNDNLDNTPDLYVYLTVRPNCSQRLVALVDQANAGRCLSDVAAYRQVTPNQNIGLSISPDDGADDDEFYDEFEEDSSRQQDGTEDAEGGYDQVEPASATRTESPDHADDEHLEEITKESTEGDDLIDYGELDLEEHPEGNAPNSFSSPVFHCKKTIDCECNECFVERLEASWRTPSVSSHQVAPRALDSADASASNSSHAAIALNRYKIDTSPLQDGPRSANWLSFQDEDDSNSQDNVTHSNIIAASDVGTAPAPNNGIAEDADSHSTSITATLNGDDKDEIDYSDDEGGNDVDTGDHDTTGAAGEDQPPSPAKPKLSVDDEITWESENEDEDEHVSATPEKPAQVSPATGKRTRADLDSAEESDDQKDVKRHRS